MLASQALYNLAAIFVKTTLLVLYLRILNPSHRARIMIWGGITFIVLFYVAITIAQVKGYAPKKGEPLGWFTPMTVSQANTLLNIIAVQGIVGIVTDFYILGIPMYFISGLSLPRGRKIGVLAIFLTGFMFVHSLHLIECY